MDIGDVFRAVEIFLLAGLATQIENHGKSFAGRAGSFGWLRGQGFFGSAGQRNWLSTGAAIDSRVLLRCDYLGHGTPRFEVSFYRVGKHIIQRGGTRK